MVSRNILIAVAIGALSVTPLLAQQGGKPRQTAASVSSDTTHVKKHTTVRKLTPAKHKSVQHSTKKTKKTPADSTKKS